tara:strand:+ start:581 stop:1009 length:429 start_codon:yes stop_codon:yes gene_type:complete
MIIACPKCKKKFDIEDSLIPEKGRLLQCSSCDNKWFFKKTIEVKKKIERISTKTKTNKIPKETEDIIIEAERNNTKVENLKKNNLPILNLLLITLISFAALIIFLDTFKIQINNFVPGFEFLLENFYETLKDFYLFTIDLIK